MKFNHANFFSEFKSRFGAVHLSQEQVDGIEFLLTAFEGEPLWTDVRQIAYAFATIYHETAASMQPVEEGYYLGNSAKVEAFQKKLRYYPYFGRGYVQLTWDYNYKKAGDKISVDLVDNPALALEPAHAFQILTHGMLEGWFTGKKLSDYISGKVADYRDARRIINGTDRAQLIAGHAMNFEHILRDSIIDG